MKRIACWLSIAALVPAPALAYVECDSPEKALALYDGNQKWRTALKERKFAEVDRYLNGVLAANAAGKTDDAEVDFIFEAVAVGGAANEPLYVEWAKAFPKSEAAPLAHAYNLIWRGWKARGSEYSSKTTQGQFEGMEQVFRQAAGELDAAEKLSQKPTLEWAKRMEILQSFGGRSDVTALYRAAIAKFPTTLAVRARYVHASAPKWGGTERQLLAIVEQAKALPEPDRRYISALVDHELGEVAEMSEDPAGAIPRYERAMTACPGLAESSRRLIVVAGAVKDYAKVIAAADYYIKRKPGDGWGYRSRGWAYGNTRKQAEAFADMQRAVQYGDVESYSTLASFYEFGVGGAPRDPKKAAELYTIAHEKGVAGADVLAQRARRMAGIK